MVILNVVFLDSKPDPKEEALLSLNATFLGKLQKAVRITCSNVFNYHYFGGRNFLANLPDKLFWWG